MWVKERKEEEKQLRERKDMKWLRKKRQEKGRHNRETHMEKRE
jgi:hypothetical protein